MNWKGIYVRISFSTNYNIFNKKFRQKITPIIFVIDIVLSKQTARNSQNILRHT